MERLDSLGLSGAQVGGAAENPDGKLEVVVATPHNSQHSSMYAHQASPDGAWTGWSDMSGSTKVSGLDLQPTVVQAGSSLDAFAGSGIVVWTSTSGDQFPGWTDDTNGFAAYSNYSPAAVMNSSGSVDVFISSDYLVYLAEISPSHDWTTWSALT